MRRISILTMLICLTAALASAATDTYISDAGSATVYGPLNAYTPLDGAWGTGVPAVLTWQHGNWPLIDGSSAEWISNTEYIEGNIAGNTWRLFEISIPIPAGAYNIAGTAQVNSDNAEEVYLNETLLGSNGEVQGPFSDNQEWSTVISYNLADLQPGDNTLAVIVRNYAGTNSATGNPTGLIYSIAVTYDEPIHVGIDIKPGSFPNSINKDGNGVIPVAILGSADFDVTQIDPASLSFEGAAVRIKGNGAPQCSVQDVSGDFTNPEGAPDGYPDLVCQFVDDTSIWAEGPGTATLTGSLYDGTPFEGSDSVNVVP